MSRDLGEELIRRLIELSNDIARGSYDEADKIFEYTKSGQYPELISELAESFGLMTVKIEAREFQLEQMIEQLRDKNIELEKTLQKVALLENIKLHLGKFVPEAVKQIIELTPDAPDLEKHTRDVSILFLDIAGYTRMSETVALDKMNYIVERYFSSFLDDIHQNKGDINETAGDGLMIIFQDPDRDLHAQNAVKTALAIQRKADSINQDLRGSFEPLVINIGINSGEAMLGSSRFEGISGTRWTFTASGPVTNVAARIGSLAKDGAILIGEETAKRVEGEFSLLDVGFYDLKNVSQPVKVFRVPQENY